MNDSTVLAAVRDSFSEVHMGTPLEQTVRRGRVLRARRRRYRAAALTGAAAIAAVAVLTTVNPGTSARNPALDAWTVTVGPDHTVSVTVRQLSDADGLQRTLRADGVPARVTFRDGIPSVTPPLPAGCRMAAMSETDNARVQDKIIGLPTGMPGGVALTLHQQAIPDGVGLFLAIESGSSSQSWGWGLDLVQVAPSCTG
jgi:hypothetical protein